MTLVFDDQLCCLISGNFSSAYYNPALGFNCLMYNSSCPILYGHLHMRLTLKEDFSFKYALEDLKLWAVHLDYCGGSYLTRLVKDTCPDTHVRCPEAYCIPSFTVNNGVRDCPHYHVTDELMEEDDFLHEDFSCPGHYKCFKSFICVHTVYLCDGIYHCPSHDDERYCRLSCPSGCRCEGFALTCSRLFNASLYADTRYLDLSGTQLTHSIASSQMHKMRFLQNLNLSRCSLTNISLPYMQPLKILDLGYNNILSFSMVNFQISPLRTSREKSTCQPKTSANS